MDVSVDPTLVYSEVVTGTLTSPSPSWSVDSLVFTVQYTLADVNEDLNNITIDVTGAQDSIGNGQTDYTPVFEFNIDTDNGHCVNIVVKKDSNQVENAARK